MGFPVAKRLCLLSPTLPPKICGVGDHSLRVLMAHRDLGWEATVVTNQANAQSALIPADLTVNPYPWSMTRLDVLERQIVSAQPDRVWVQWVPHLYHPRGVVPAMPLLLRRLHHRGIPIVLMVHELWMDGPHWPHRALGNLQKLNLSLMMRSADTIAISSYAWTERFKKLWSQHAVRMRWFPVSSNIPYQPASDQQKQEFRAQWGLHPDRPTLLIFSPSGSGVAHNLIQHTWKVLRHQLPNIQCLVIGAVSDALKQKLFPRDSTDDHHPVKWLGAQNPASLSIIFQMADLQLAPFIDGISSRRTSVLAGMNHGICVLTTQPPPGIGDPLEQSGLAMTGLVENDFAQEALRLLTSPTERKERAQKGQEFYYDWFSPYQLTRRLRGLEIPRGL